MAEVAQKLQPTGQPTDGISVAATSAGFSLTAIPMLRVPIRVGITGWRMGRFGSSPRNRRNHCTPSPRTIQSASTRS